MGKGPLELTWRLFIAIMVNIERIILKEIF
jgi:hypothetical protein